MQTRLGSLWKESFKTRTEGRRSNVQRKLRKCKDKVKFLKRENATGLAARIYLHCHNKEKHKILNSYIMRIGEINYYEDRKVISHEMAIYTFIYRYIKSSNKRTARGVWWDEYLPCPNPWKLWILPYMAKGNFQKSWVLRWDEPGWFRWAKYNYKGPLRGKQSQ